MSTPESIATTKPAPRGGLGAVRFAVLLGPLIFGAYVVSLGISAEDEVRRLACGPPIHSAIEGVRVVGVLLALAASAPIYLYVFWNLAGPRYKRGLALAVATGLIALVISGASLATLPLIVIFLPFLEYGIYESLSRPLLSLLGLKPIPVDTFLAVMTFRIPLFAGFVLSQGLLVWLATKTYRREAGDERMLIRGFAKAALASAKASLLTAKINLDYCTIKSPAKGVVIDRRVNIGQTVVSSLSAPSLFLISSDLKHTMQVWISVNEADVGSLTAGSPVTFTVDAIPNQVFHGRLGQVRLNATMTQNVVTYTVEVDVDNSDGRLLPYLTANAQFEIGRREGVLLVANAALRWTPHADQMAPDRGERPSDRRRWSGGDDTGDNTGTRAIVWADEGEFVRPVPVRAKLTDGTFTEVEGRGLTEGLRVVIGEGPRGAEAAAQPAERSPFAPQGFRGQRAGQGQAQRNQEQEAPPSGEVR